MYYILSMYYNTTMHHVVIMLYLRIHGWGDYGIQDAIPTDHGQDLDIRISGSWGHGYHDTYTLPGWYHGNDHNTLPKHM